MKKITILMFLLSGVLFSCKKEKKNEVTPDKPVNVIPTVSITEPTHNGSTYTNRSTPLPMGGAIYFADVTISANAADSDGTISKVEFYDGSSLLHSDDTAPYTFTASLLEGEHTLTAKAYDNAEAVTTSSAVVYTVVYNCNCAKVGEQ